MAVVLLSGDLATQSRVQGVATRLGKPFHGAFGEARVVELCGSGDVTAVAIDLSMSGLDVAGLVTALKAQDGAHPRVVAFGPHVHEDRLAAAQAAGCDVVVSRGQFFSQMDAILGG